MEEKKAIINKDTLIPIGLVITICGCVWFISDLNARVKNIEDNMSTISTMAERMARVETKVDSIKETIDAIK